MLRLMDVLSTHLPLRRCPTAQPARNARSHFDTLRMLHQEMLEQGYTPSLVPPSSSSSSSPSYVPHRRAGVRLRVFSRLASGGVVTD